MTKPVVDAFFFGRALAEILNQKIEDNLSNALSELGKFDAEQREKLRQFTEDVIARAVQEIETRTTGVNGTSTTVDSTSGADLQEMIDDLRAEIASLRSELTRYRNQSQS